MNGRAMNADPSPHPNPMKTAARRARRANRFEAHAACVRCGITTLETLVPLKRRFLEDHHVCGQANDAALTVPVCRNCHAVLTERQQAAGVTFATPPTILHQIAAALESLFAFLYELCERGMGWVAALSGLIEDLDSVYPEWRRLPHARALGVAA